MCYLYGDSKQAFESFAIIIPLHYNSIPKIFVLCERVCTFCPIKSVFFWFLDIPEYTEVLQFNSIYVLSKECLRFS